MSITAPLITGENHRAVIARLLGRMPDTIATCAGGGNNHVCRVESASTRYLAKCYFTSAHDPRDRLDSEWRFLSYARHAGIDNVPQPIARDDAAHMALYSFLEGMKPQQITADLVRQAGQLMTHLNSDRQSSEARALPLASESRFSAADTVALLSERLKTLRQEAIHGPADFSSLMNEMEGLFSEYAQRLLAGYASLGMQPDTTLEQQSRCLSPSDFGFHNSLLLPSGRLQFIDFEYAGWDDPAKTLCDFFLHPGHAVDTAWVGILIQEMQGIPLPAHTLARTAMLYPLFALRWCCIILNVFVPQWAARRAFADPAWDARAAQQQQLEKARQMLHRIGHNPFKDMM